MITRILVALLLVLLAVVVWQRGSVSIAQRAADAAAGERDAAHAELAQANRIITAERANAVAANAVAAQYEQEKADAQAASDRIVADLRTGNQRLHARWQAAIATSELSAAAATAAVADGGPADRHESAGRIVRAADECVAQVKALQAFALLCSWGGQ